MISKICIKRPVTTAMMIILVLLGGLLSYSKLEMAYMPSTDMPMMAVMTNYSGVGPEEIESLITEPIEQQLSTLTGVESITSTSSLGSSRVMIEFSEGTDLDQKTNDVRDKLDRITRMLPDDADEPTIMKMDSNQTSVMVSISSAEYTPTALYTLIDNDISDDFERIDGVASVDIMGGNEEEIKIIVDKDALNTFGITFDTIRQSISSENTNVSAGEALQGDQYLDLRAVGEFKSLEEIKNLPITTKGGTVISLKEVAEVVQVEKEREMLSLINGSEGIMMSLTKESDANIVTVSDSITETINSLKQQYPELNIRLMTTTSDYIKTSINNVISTGFQAAAIAVIIIFLFLGDWRNSLVIGISIPTSIMATLVMMYLCGMTMNTISMGGIVIGIGMLVDNSVVVLENISSYYNRGYSPEDAAYEGTQEVAMAIVASTLTSVAVFAPLAFVSGTVGAMLKDVAMTICFALTASIVVALTFVPMACAKLLSNEKRRRRVLRIPVLTVIKNKWLGFLAFMDHIYGNAIKRCLKHRKLIFIAVIALFAASLCTIPFMGTDLMQSSDEGAFSVSISFPDGTVYEKTEETLYRALDLIGEIPESESMYAMVRGSGSAQLTYNLVDSDKRARSTAEIVSEVKQKLSVIAGAEINVSESSMARGSMGGNSNLSIKIKGDDMDTLYEISDELVSIISSMEGAEDVTSSLDDSLAQGNIVVNRTKAAKYGVSTTSIASAVSTAISGSTVSTLKQDGTEIDIIIQYPEDEYKYVPDIENILVSTSSGSKIPVSEVADIVIGESATSINREDMQTYFSISGNFPNLQTSEVQQLITQRLNDYIFPEGYSYEFGGRMEMMNNMMSNLKTVIIVAVLLVYIVMASQFESLIYPFMIMFTMPIAVTGGIFGLFITGKSIDMYAMMGFVMLIGLVVNNAIVLVDYTNQLREKSNMGCDEALCIAGESRLRPILMTTSTTVLGLVPMALALSTGTESMQTLGIAVIFGLSISTLLTLLFIPVLYSLVNSALKKLGSVWRRFLDKHFPYDEIEEG